MKSSLVLHIIVVLQQGKGCWITCMHKSTIRIFSKCPLILFSLAPQMITLPYQSSTPVSLLGIQSVIKSHEDRAGTTEQICVVSLCYS